MRHPNILSFLHSTEVETHDGSTSKVTIYIVTEPVMPLSDKIKELGLKATQRYALFLLMSIRKIGQKDIIVCGNFYLFQQIIS